MKPFPKIGGRLISFLLWLFLLWPSVGLFLLGAVAVHDWLNPQHLKHLGCAHLFYLGILTGFLAWDMSKPTKN